MVASAGAVLAALAHRAEIQALEDPESPARMFLMDVDRTLAELGFTEPLDQLGAEAVALVLYAEGWDGRDS